IYKNDVRLSVPKQHAILNKLEKLPNRYVLQDLVQTLHPYLHASVAEISFDCTSYKLTWCKRCFANYKIINILVFKKNLALHHLPLISKAKFVIYVARNAQTKMNFK